MVDKEKDLLLWNGSDILISVAGARRHVVSTQDKSGKRFTSPCLIRHGT